MTYSNSFFLFSCILIGGLTLSANAQACTDEFKPVCGYWMHTSKTQTFANECKMREAGAKNRHAGSCTDTKSGNSPSNKPASKSTP
jgi:Kazal-type serine protease inhibitor domain